MSVTCKGGCTSLWLSRWVPSIIQMFINIKIFRWRKPPAFIRVCWIVWTLLQKVEFRNFGSWSWASQMQRAPLLLEIFQVPNAGVADIKKDITKFITKVKNPKHRHDDGRPSASRRWLSYVALRTCEFSKLPQGIPKRWYQVSYLTGVMQLLL